MRNAAKRLIQKALAPLGYEVSKIRGHEFTQDGVHYRADRCSTGRTPEGEWAAQGAVRMIRESGRRELAILDICCGVGNIGLTIWSRLRQEPDVVSSLTFADINIFNLLSVRRTVRVNRIDEALEGRIACYLSDGLSHVPQSHTFDVIVGNPPHYIAEESDEWISSGRLSTVDFGWSFHKQFYQDAHQWLKGGGQIWLFENGDASRVEDSLPLISANAELTFLRTLPEPSAPRFFWVISERLAVAPVKADPSSTQGSTHLTHMP